jgi:hypothetical protein
VGLDSLECLAEVYKDGDVKNAIGVQVQVPAATIEGNEKP